MMVAAGGAPEVSKEGDERELPPGTGVLGMWVFLAALSMLFGATLLGYLLTRLRAPQWPPPGMPHLPLVLVFSTLVILVSSWTAQGALMAARAQHPDVLRRGLLLTFLLGVLFLGSQSFAWAAMLPAVEKIGLRQPYSLPAVPVDNTPRQFAFLFFTLTVLHAVHVLGGLVAFAFARFSRIDYRRPIAALGRVRHAVVYWHFLAVVGVVMYIVLLI